MTGKSGLHDIEVKIHHETDQAVLVDHAGGKPVWLPKSQIEIENQRNGLALVTAPEWLLLEKGLI